MPVHHTQVRERTAEVVAGFGELGEIRAIYRRSAITPQFLAQGNGEEGDSAMLGDVRFLGRVLVSWDYLDEKGKPFPVDTATLEELPLEIVEGVARAIAEDLRPNPKSGASSGGSFSTGDA